jgi:hypothetical protein
VRRLGLPITSERVHHSLGSVSSTTRGVAVTTGAGTSATKGTIAELIASTPFRSRFFVFWAFDYATNAGTSKGSLDLMVGAGGSEQILVADMLHGFCGGYAGIGPKTWAFPLALEEGVRLSVRACGERLSTTFRVGITLYELARGPGGWYGTRCDTVGASAPNGVAMTPGGASSEGAWVEAVASTARAYGAIVPSLQIDGETSVNARNCSLDIGIGAAAAEQAFPQPFEFMSDTTEAMSGPHGHASPIYQDIPAGVRLAMRAGESSTPDGFQGALHLVY